jgi:hypothetical protein
VTDAEGSVIPNSGMMLPVMGTTETWSKGVGLAGIIWAAKQKQGSTGSRYGIQEKPL